MGLCLLFVDAVSVEFALADKCLMRVMAKCGTLRSLMEVASMEISQGSKTALAASQGFCLCCVLVVLVVCLSSHLLHRCQAGL
jgi:hypothetical protein